MPRSKSKRQRYVPPKTAKAPPSPSWVPIVGLVLLALSLAVILFVYIFPGVLPGGNYWLLGGFALMAGGLLVLSRWR